MKKLIILLSCAIILTSSCTSKEPEKDTPNQAEETSSDSSQKSDTAIADRTTPAESEPVTEVPAPAEEPVPETPSGAAELYTDGQQISLDPSWQYADFSAIHSGSAVIYLAQSNRKNIVIGLNAGHGTSGGSSVKTQCHPDGSAKTTSGSTSQGATVATAVSGGMSFLDGTPESTVTLRMAQILKEKLLSDGYDVLMIRDADDVQLDNVARTVICNNIADCHIALHWDGDGLNYDKGCFYISVPDALKNMEPVASHWQEHDLLGSNLVEGLRANACSIYQNGSMAIDLTQTSYSTIPSVDIELGNAASDHSDATLDQLGNGLLQGIHSFYSN